MAARPWGIITGKLHHPICAKNDNNNTVSQSLSCKWRPTLRMFRFAGGGHQEILAKVSAWIVVSIRTHKFLTWYHNNYILYLCKNLNRNNKKLQFKDVSILVVLGESSIFLFLSIFRLIE